MIKKEMIAMLLAGGQGSRLGVLTQKVAKPAVSFGGKYRIIDFPLSNCINSGVDTVGVLTQYQPLRLNSHIGIGIPWDLDRNVGSALDSPEKKRQTVRPDRPLCQMFLTSEFFPCCSPFSMNNAHTRHSQNAPVALHPLVEGTCDHFILLFFCQFDKVDRIS